MNSLLPILAIETTGEMCSIAILVKQNEFVELSYLKKHIHSEKLFDLINSALLQTGLEMNNINSFAISVGPGSFTGLRIGMAAVKGLAFGAGKPVIPVPTLDAYAFELNEYVKEGETFRIINKASIDDVYFAHYLKQNALPKLIEGVSLVQLDELEDLKHTLTFGNYAKSNFTGKSGPSALSIATWAYLFGKDLVTFEYDNLEPFYLKEFVGRKKG